MMHREAKVISATQEAVCLEIAPRQAACAHCPSPVLCQAGMAPTAGKFRRYHLPNTMNLNTDDAGSTVAITVADGAVFRMACLSYGMPLFLLLGCAGVGQLFGGDAGAMLGMLLGLTLGFLLLRYVSPYGRLLRIPCLLDMQKSPCEQNGAGISGSTLHLRQFVSPSHLPGAATRTATGEQVRKVGT